jgi:hypothetical protein
LLQGRERVRALDGLSGYLVEEGLGAPLLLALLGDVGVRPEPANDLALAVCSVT